VQFQTSTDWLFVELSLYFYFLSFWLINSHWSLYLLWSFVVLFFFGFALFLFVVQVVLEAEVFHGHLEAFYLLHQRLGILRTVVEVHVYLLVVPDNADALLDIFW